MRLRHPSASVFLLTILAVALNAQPASKGGINAIQPEPLKEWLTYIASDELQGRATYSEGLGLAAGYIAGHLKEWGVKPAGDNGTYLQVVKNVGVRTTSRASITVDVNGQTRTFKDGEGIAFPKNMGGKQTVVADQVQFVGYGMKLPSGHDDYAKVDPRGKVVVWLGPGGPKTAESGLYRLLRGDARNRAALEKGAIATIGPAGAGFGRGRGNGRGTSEPEDEQSAEGRAGSTSSSTAGPGRGRGASVDTDFETVQRFDNKIPPSVTAQDEFFEFLFSGSDIKYAELKQKVTNQEPLPPFALKGVKITFNVDADYSIVRTRLTHNVVGIVEGSDPKLKDTYVAYGAHYDHTGYREAGQDGSRCPGDPNDLINNGADDDGSGTVAIMAIARAFALGPKPKRSTLFVWHAGEETGLLGSRYNADYPVVPLDKIVAQLNMDMVGRNKDDDPKQANTVFVVGSDRISTELHNINEDANSALPKPLTMNYEMNDPADTESIYTRSDHYSYAAKGIPIIFYFTGMHADYHCPSDTVDKIIFDKIARVAQLAYETGRRVANLEHAPVRDNKGPRVGRTVTGKLKH
jgi:Peptidase family M28